MICAFMLLARPDSSVGRAHGYNGSGGLGFVQ